MCRIFPGHVQELTETCPRLSVWHSCPSQQDRVCTRSIENPQNKLPFSQRNVSSIESSKQTEGRIYKNSKTNHGRHCDARRIIEFYDDRIGRLESRGRELRHDRRELGAAR